MGQLESSLLIYTVAQTSKNHLSLCDISATGPKSYKIMPVIRTFCIKLKCQSRTISLSLFVTYSVRDLICYVSYCA